MLIKSDRIEYRFLVFHCNQIKKLFDFFFQVGYNLFVPTMDRAVSVGRDTESKYNNFIYLVQRILQLKVGNRLSHKFTALQDIIGNRMSVSYSSFSQVEPSSALKSHITIHKTLHSF